MDTMLLEALEEAITYQKSVESTLQATLEEAPRNSYPCIRHSLEAIQLGRERVHAAVEAVKDLLPNGHSVKISDTGLCSP